MSCDYILPLASGIWQEMEEPSSVSISFISGKLVSNFFLGQLGALTYKCYENVSGCIIPPLDNGEQGIYALLYLGDYYKKQVKSYIGAAGVKRVLSVAEGDSRISFSNQNSEAQTIRTLAKDYNDQAKEMADLYNRGLATARGVSFYTIEQYSPVNNIGNNYSPRI